MTFPLSPNTFYHIYNRGNNSETIFKETRNYSYFLSLYSRHISAVADTYAYCLLPNHFHFLIRIRESNRSTSAEIKPSEAFRRLFLSYAKAINRSYKRTGSLFEKSFKRKPILHERYFNHVVIYIHRNPQTHGLVEDFRDWQFSSYESLLTSAETALMRPTVLDWFGGPDAFADAHLQSPYEDDAWLE